MKTRKTTAFYVEALIITLFLLASSAVLLKMFGAARQISGEARAGADAVLIAQNASEQFVSLLENGLAPSEAAKQMGGKSIETGFVIAYSSSGEIAEGGEYSVALSTVTQTAKTGSTHDINIKVYSTADKKLLFELKTMKFVS